MTFSPDVPSSALGPNEYNSGKNVEADVRGIRSVAGDEIILPSVPGTPTYISGGYRKPQSQNDNDFYFITATTEGYWYCSNGGAWQEINPVGLVFTTYNQATNITEGWNGTVPFFNDESNPPMFWPEFTGTSLETTGASSAAGTSTITFAPQNDTLSDVTITSRAGTFAFNGDTVLQVGQRVDVSGTNTNNIGFTIYNLGLDIMDNKGNFSFADTLAPVSMIGGIAGTTLTVASVSSGVIYAGMELTGTGVTAGTKITAFVSGSSVGASVWTVSPSQTVTAGTAITGQLEYPLVNGQSIEVIGAISNTDTTLSTVQITNAIGDFACTATTLQAGQSVVVSGTVTNTPITLGTVACTGIVGQFSCAAASATLYAGQTVEVTGTVSASPFTLGTVAITGSTGTFSCAATTLSVGQVVTVSGTNTNTLNQTLTNLQITGTAGQFSCDAVAVTLQVGQTVQIAGNLTGTGGIVGLTNPDTFQISATNGSTTFTLQKAGSAIVTTAGTTVGLTATVLSPQITSYTDPTSYVITVTNGSTTFTLANLDSTPVATRGGIPANLTFTVEAMEITGYADPTTYLIASTNGSTAFTLASASGIPLDTRGGSAAGLTFTVLVPDILGYINPSTYLISTTDGSSTFRLVNAVTGTALTTQGGRPTGLTFTLKAPGIVGYTDPTTYYIRQTNGNTFFQLEDIAGNLLTTTGGTPLGTFRVRPRAPQITGYSDPSTYYITSVSGGNEFTLSATPGGGAITTRAGTPVGLTYTYSPFGIGQTIVVEGVVPTGFRGTYTVTGVSMSSVSYAGSTAGPLTQQGSISDPQPKLIMYGNAVPLELTNIQTDPTNTNNQIITLSTTQSAPPYTAGEQIVISYVNNYFNGQFTVVSSTTTTITYTGKPGANYPEGETGSVAALYTWNYNPNWTGLYAKWMRIYNTPNVGSILVAGGLTATTLDGTVEEYPVTVRWSQAFALNEAPVTWEPTVTNVANELEVPLRGAALDAFPCNGQLFVCSTWDTVVFSPINYSTTSAPILGVRLFNQGRGLLSSNCWANTDKMVYGIDARDVWTFDGQNFSGLGNQRVKNWLFDQIDPEYVDRVFLQTNTQKNQIEIYYPTVPPSIANIAIVDTAGTFTCTINNNGESGIMRTGLSVVLSGTELGTGSISGYSGGPTTYYVVDSYSIDGVQYFQLSTTPTGAGVTTTPGTVSGVGFTFISNGVPNQMLSYRHDLDCFNAPRDVQSATMSCEAPYWSSLEWYYNIAGTNITGAGVNARFNVLRQPSSAEINYIVVPASNTGGTGYAVGNTIRILGTAVGGSTPANDIVLTVAETAGSGRIVSVTATGTSLSDWVYNSGLRTVAYARGLLDRTIVQKDDGYNFLGPQTRSYPVDSVFRRDNIKLLADYSGKLMVHRVLPEVQNLNKFNLPINPVNEDYLIGDVSVRVEGANSVGQAPVETTAVTIATNTDYPWMQITQNAHRVNSLEISNSSLTTIWICNAATWQYTQTEDDR